MYAPGQVELRPGILRDGQAALASARFASVFHGSSGSSPDDVRTAIVAGVVEVNLDTDAQYAFTRAIAGHVLADYDGVPKLDGGIGHKSDDDPRSWGAKAETALASHVAGAARLFGSAGRSLLRS